MSAPIILTDEQKKDLQAAALAVCVADKEPELGFAPIRPITEMNFDRNALEPVDPENPEKKREFVWSVWFTKPQSSKNEHIYANNWPTVEVQGKPGEKVLDEEGLEIRPDFMVVSEDLNFGDYDTLLEQLKKVPYLKKLPDNVYHKNTTTRLHLGLPDCNPVLERKVSEADASAVSFMIENQICPSTKVKRPVIVCDKDGKLLKQKEFYENQIRHVYKEPQPKNKIDGSEGYFSAEFEVSIDKHTPNLLVPNVELIKNKEWIDLSHIGSEAIVEDSDEEGLTYGEQVRRELVKRAWIMDGPIEIEEIYAIVSAKQFRQINLAEVKTADRLALIVRHGGISITTQTQRVSWMVERGLVFPRDLFPNSAKSAPVHYSFVLKGKSGGASMKRPQSYNPCGEGTSDEQPPNKYVAED